MRHTIEKLDDEHWIIDSNIDVVYFNTYGKAGWYISKPTGDETPEIKETFVHAIEYAMNETETKKQVMEPPMGL